MTCLFYAKCKEKNIPYFSLAIDRHLVRIVVINVHFYFNLAAIRSNSISSSAYYSRLNRHSLNDKAWCCKYLRHFSFLNIFLFAAPFLIQLLLADLLTGEGVGVEPNPKVYIKNAPPPPISHWSLPVTGEGVGWSP